MWYERTRQNVYSSQNADVTGSVPRGFSDLSIGSELDLCHCQQKGHRNPSGTWPMGVAH